MASSLTVAEPLKHCRVIHDLDGLFQNLRGARDRIQKGIVPSEEVKKRFEGQRVCGERAPFAFERDALAPRIL
jgi:hypothetical protein